LQGGEYRDQGTSDSFDVTVQIPYPSEEEAETATSDLGDRGKCVKTLMEFLLHTSECGYTVCAQCEGYGSSENESFDGCSACSGFGLVKNL